MGIIVSGAQLAEILGFTPEKLAHYRRQPSFPIVFRGGSKGQASKYNTEYVHKWIIDQALGRSGATYDINAERARLVKTKADREELLLKRDTGALMPLSDIIAQDAKMMVAARTRLLGIPSLLRARNPNMSQREMELVDGVIRDVLADLSRMPHNPIDDSDGEVIDEGEEEE